MVVKFCQCFCSGRGVECIFYDVFTEAEDNLQLGLGVIPPQKCFAFRGSECNFPRFPGTSFINENMEKSEAFLKYTYCGRPAEPAILISTLVSNACAAVI